MDYKIIRSTRKTISLSVNEEGFVVVRAPKGCPIQTIEEMITSNISWIEKKKNIYIEQQKKYENISKYSESEKVLYRKKAREVICSQVEFYAIKMNVSFGRVSIREQKTRWGSCSQSGNLNFNWKLIFAPPGVLDYVVVHELSHRFQMNHSKAFWTIVENVLPNYKEYRQWLKENGLWMKVYSRNLNLIWNNLLIALKIHLDKLNNIIKRSCVIIQI